MPEDKLAAYVNKHYTPQKPRIRKMLLTSQKNKQGECKVYIEICKYEYISNNEKYKETFKRISCDVTVLPANWSKKKQEVLKNDFDYNIKNQIINQKYSEILKYINSESIDHQFDRLNKLEMLKIEELFPSRKMLLTKYLTDYLQEFIDFKKINSSRGTWKEYITLKNRLLKYEIKINKKLKFEDITLSFADNHSNWMITLNYNVHTIHKHFQLLKTFLNYYNERAKDLNINVLDDYKKKNFQKGRNVSEPPKPLTREEFKTLTSNTIDNERLERTRKLAILQITTGLRYSDLFRIDENMIKNNAIAISPIKTINKTNNTIYIPLNDYSINILKAFNNNTCKLKLSNQKYNDNLKAMFESIGITNIFTSHNLRDTFITFSVESGVDIPTILSWTGQTKYEVMKRYIKLAESHSVSKMKGVF